MEVPDYGIPTYDENILDYGLDDLFHEGIQPGQNKQFVCVMVTSEIRE